MNLHTNSIDVISDLYAKGFTNDFQLLGNDLLWVQGRLFIRAGEFMILEYHKITQPKNSTNELTIFGIIAPWHNIKGILLHHNNKSVSGSTPPVLVKKLNELSIHSCVN